MPVVPRYERVADPAGGPAITPPDLGAGDQTSRAAVNLLADERRKLHQLVVLDYDNQIAQFQSTLESDLLNRQGKTAFGAVPEAQQKWQSFSQQLLAPLRNESQKQAVQGRLATRWTQTHGAVQQHVAQERVAFDNQAVTSWLANAKEQVARDYADEDAVQAHLSEQAAVIRDAADRHGLDTESRDLALAQNRSDTYETVLEQMMRNGQGTMAMDYFRALPPGSLTTKASARLQGKLDESFTSAEADHLAMAALSTLTPDDPTTPMNEFDVMTRVRKATTDPAVRKVAAGLVNQYVGDWNARAAQVYDGYIQSVYKAAAADQPYTDILQSAAYRNLTGEDQVRLKTALAAAKQKEDDEGVKNAQALRWGQLVSDTNALLTTNLEQELVEQKIDRAQYKALVTAREKFDPLKSEQAKNAIKRVDKAATDRLFNLEDRADNMAQWNRAKNLLQTYIQNNWDKPDYLPEEYAQKLIEPVEESWTQHLLDLVTFGQPGRDTATTEKYQQLAGQAGVDPKRQQAIEILTQAGKPVTDANIDYVQGQLQ